MKSKTIVLIHGMFMNPLCWEKWIPYYQAKGYKVLAPAWPGRDKSVEELRKNHPDPELPKLKLNNVVEHIANFIQAWTKSLPSSVTRWADWLCSCCFNAI